MITVAFLVHSLRNGGIERSVTRIVNCLDPCEFTPLIICLDQSGPAAAWLEVDVEVIELQKRSGNDLRAVLRLAKVLSQHGVDILQSHNWGTLIEGVIARRLSHTPVHIHAERGTVLGMVEPKGAKHWVRSVAMAQALKRVDRVISNSSAVAERVQERCGYDASRITIIPNGVPPFALDDREGVRRRLRSQIGLDETSVLIGSVGRLAKVKGFDVAIAAFAALSVDYPKAHLLLVGDGPEQAHLARLAEDSGLSSRIHLVGHQANVQPWLASMDIYLNSSRSEGMSQSIVEAMSAGLPVVATDVGDSDRMIACPGFECGLIAASESVSSLESTLRTILVDKNKRELFSRNALERHSSQYSAQTFRIAIERIYQQSAVSVAPNTNNLVVKGGAN